MGRTAVVLGAEYALDAIAGLAAAGHCFYTAQGADSGRQVQGEFRGGRIAFVTATPQHKCPAAPYEAALLVDGELRRRLGDRTQIDFHATEPGPMLTAGTEVSAALRQILAGRGIAYHPGRQITAADATARRLHFADSGEAD
jgi:sulfide:quinone oxidoreductase